MAYNSSSFLRVPGWLNPVSRCRDCSVLLKDSEDTRCWYCTQRPYKIKGVCADCGEEIHDQHEMRFKLFGNYCFSCDLNAEKSVPEIPHHPTLF